MTTAMHPPADRRCQIYVGNDEDRNLDRCSNEGTHWEKWAGCHCADPDTHVCEGDFYSWECESPHNPTKEAA